MKRKRWPFMASAMIIGVGLFSAGCRTRLPEQPITRTPPQNAGAPKISRLVDLGSGALTEGARLSDDRADERFSPGEWMLLQGSNLSGADVTIDGRSVPIQWYCGGSALIKVPTGLSPRKSHNLLVATTRGKVRRAFDSSHYVLSTDTDGNALHFIRTNPNHRGGIEPEWLERKQTRPMFNAVSTDGAYAFSFNLAEAEDAKEKGLKGSHFLEINTLDLNAPNGPESVNKTTVSLDSSPSDVSLNSDGLAALLSKRHIVFVDLKNPLKPKEVSRLDLPGKEGKTTFSTITFIKNNTLAVLLDAQGNTVHLVDLKNVGKPVIVGHKRLLADKTIPLVVHVVADPAEDSRFWVLVSPNLRSLSAKISETYKKLIKGKERDPAKKGVYGFLPITVDGQHRMTEGRAIDLAPGFAYHFAAFHDDGKAYVTSSRLDLMDLSSWKKNKSNAVTRAAAFLRDTLYFGRVVAVDTEKRTVERSAHGAGIYMHLVCVPDIGPVFNLIKFGPSLGFPFVTPKWGMGIKSTGTYAKRKMNLWTIMPPYSAGCVTYQR